MADRPTKLKPRVDRVLVENLPEEKERKSGIIIPDTALGKEPLKYAKVLKAGEKCEGIKEGEIVGYQNGAGMEVIETIDGEKISRHIIRDQDLIVVVE